MNILLTNDDGIYAPTLRCLYHALLKAGHSVQVVAPLSEQSAVGHAVTIHSPLRMTAIVEQNFTGIAINGTPVDCIKFALCTMYNDQAPDIVISGINPGPNVGPDVKYSGTVSAASEASASGILAVAFSFNNRSPFDLENYADFAVSLAEKFQKNPADGVKLLNVNFPNCCFRDCKGIRPCRQTTSPWIDSYVENKDPNGRSYWWIKGFIPAEENDNSSDFALLNQNYITVTPLKYDFTDYKSLDKLANFDITMPKNTVCETDRK